MQTMATISILAAAAMAGGCASVQYGPVKVTSFARSSDIKHLEYFEGAQGGTVRALRMEGFQGDGVQGAARDGVHGARGPTRPRLADRGLGAPCVPAGGRPRARRMTAQTASAQAWPDFSTTPRPGSGR